MKPLVTVFVLLVVMSTVTNAQNKDEKTPLSAPSAAKLQPLNVKPGLWETTTNFTTVGQMPIPQGMLDKLTPEQRARFEERMKANAAPNGAMHTNTNKKCVSREDVEKMEFGEGKGQCTQTVTTSTSTTAKGKITCDSEGMHWTATMEAQAPDPEHVKGSSHGTASAGGRTMNVDATFVSKWLGSNCGEVK